ncbi:MAG TPA: hypothetical protein VFZ31_05050 [Vicinamibacterales bacterium]
MTIPKIAAAGLVATAAFAVAMVINISGNQVANVSGDFRNAATAEIRDAQGRVLLRGTLPPVTGDQDDVERQVTLTATPEGGQAAGTAEIEFSKAEPTTQEIEFEATGLPARAIVTLVLDGKDVISAAADDKGRADAEFDVPIAPRR